MSIRESGADVSGSMVGAALRERLFGGQRIGQLIKSLSLLPGLVKAIGHSLPECVVELATKPLPPEVACQLPEELRPRAKAFQHLFFCEGDFARAFQAASVHCNVEVDATFVCENLVGFPYHIYLVVQKG